MNKYVKKRIIKKHFNLHVFISIILLFTLKLESRGKKKKKCLLHEKAIFGLFIKKINIYIFTIKTPFVRFYNNSIFKEKKIFSLSS